MTDAPDIPLVDNTSKIERARAWFGARPFLVNLILVLLLWGASFGLHFHWLGYPRAVVFDETYYIPMAQKYIHGVFYQEEHPPLARLLITLGQALVNPNAPSNEFLYSETINEDWPQTVDMTGYRLFPAIFGTFLSPLFFLTLLTITGKRWLSFAGGLTVLLDSALLAQSRFALPESFLLAFMLLTIWLFAILWRGRQDIKLSTYLLWAVWGLAFAAAFLVKMTALFLGMLVAVYFLWLAWQRLFHRLAHFFVIFGLAFVVMFFLTWQTHFSLLDKLNPVNDYNISATHRAILAGTEDISPTSRFFIQLVDNYLYTFERHNSVPTLRLGAPDEIGSPWFQWPFGGKAISYRWETPDGETYRTIYLIGNPAVWLASLLGVLLGSALLLTNLLFGYYRSGQRSWIYIFVLLYWTYMAGIIPIQRVMYLYHYLPPLLVGLLVFFIILPEIPAFTRHIRVAIVTVVLLSALAGFVAYKPYVYYEPLTRQQITQRAFWPVWQMQIGSDLIQQDE